jgi:hypothetical protein
MRVLCANCAARTQIVTIRNMGSARTVFRCDDLPFNIKVLLTHLL